VQEIKHDFEQFALMDLSNTATHKDPDVRKSLV